MELERMVIELRKIQDGAFQYLFDSGRPTGVKIGYTD
jgi:hypothetical protein